MKKHRLLACAAASACCLSGVSAIPAASAETESALLDISHFSVMDENLVYLGADYLHDASVLFDDQDKVPSSVTQLEVGTELWNKTSRTNWKPNLQAEYGEDSFYIDLGANYVITGICFLDANGIQDWTVEYGEPFAWQTLTQFTTDQYMAWRSVTPTETHTTRYLRFSTSCGDSGVSELALYGYQVSELTEAQKAKTAAKPSGGEKTSLTAGQKIGFNAFIDDPMTAIMAAGNVREYHNFSWLLDETGKVKFTQGTWGDMDSYYASMKAQDISIIPCFQGGSSVVSGSDDPPEIPTAPGADTTDPKSYAVHAQAMYQVAARYGSNTEIDPATLNVADGSEEKIGLGLLHAAENSNEPNKTWGGKADYFTPYELAAMCSADYDGHEGTIPNAGVKTADPDFKLAVGGLLTTEFVLDYLSEMKLWFDYNRSDGKFAVDIINVHLSPNAIDPENSGMVKKIQEIQAWIDENAPGTELWISEFEVPMGDCAIEGVDNHENETYQLRYAQRVARTYLTAIGAGVDRMTKFQLRDEGGGGVYADSGLVTEKGKWDKKLAWYYVSCMTTVLEHADLLAASAENGICCQTFTDRTNGNTIYCLWSPTSDGTTIPGYSISVGNAAHAYLTVPGTYAEGVTTELEINKESVSVDISETPVFLTVSGQTQTIINGKGQYITPQSLCLSSDNSTEICDLSAAPSDSTLDQFYRMFDEPDTMPQFYYGNTSALETPETNVTASGITCYVTLDAPYVLNGFGVYDTYGTGSLEIYDANTDTLLWSSDMGGYMYRNIALTDESQPTDKLKIVKGGGDLNELAIYGYPAPEQSEVAADVNEDGVFSIADVVLLQQWLLAKSVTLANPEAADVYADGILNGFDLATMRTMLLKS
ncbi:dockerin type I repeat-containing protein [uncultured Ruminococcus sp.]|uniref:dockerin type I repeat-containing protein n=1 Tax=uncultured Ruminococcus sp. TaxID=165186 RepID=UPI00261279BC|nr:dockerin type I repeat-containing protein [uncultured Ruminococcus sp.]